MEPVTRTVESLGTFVNISIHDNPREKYFERSFEIIDQVYRLMSLQLPDSDLDRLNSAAGVEPVEIHPLTMEVLLRSVEIQQQSGGRFTPMIGPLVELWDITGDNPQVPSDDELQSAIDAVSLEFLELYPSDNPEDVPNRAYISRVGAGVDLGGIAKGFAADLVSDYLKSVGVERAILDFGGNILTIGRKNEERPWIIGLQRPDNIRGRYLGTVPAEDVSVVTSGVYERFFEQDGKRYHHLLNPDDGFPVENGLEGVVIISDNSMTADGLSTAVFGLGLEAGLELANSTADFEAIFITADRRVIPSREIAADFRLLDEDYMLEIPNYGSQD